MRKSWKERLENDLGLPQVKPIPSRMRRRHGQGTIVIPAPMEVAKAMYQVPKGKLTTVARIAETLARAHDATVGCSVTTGIFAWIAAYAADEAARKGKKNVFPYWRVLKAGGELNSKCPGGVENLIGRLESEGHQVFQRGRRLLRPGLRTKADEFVTV